jgi:probable rRNA maturation factor
MPSDDSAVLFRCGSFRLDRAALRQFAATLRDDVARRPFTCLIARDDDLQRLNRDFLGHDYPTDVLSFPSGARDGLLGEIAISLDRARAQAAEHGHDVEDEIRILMLHGVLHLMGLDHERDRGKMRRVETRWRKSLQLPTGLIERVRA